VDRRAQFYVSSWTLVGVALAGGFPGHFYNSVEIFLSSSLALIRSVFIPAGERESLKLLLQSPIDPDLISNAKSVKEAISAVAVNSGNDELTMDLTLSC